MKVKRLLDVVLALSGLVIFSPLLLTIMALIILDDGPPVIFSQERIGLNLRSFTLLKLRSMRYGRITRVGRWIRRTGLDEIPQFVNVLSGSMSMVGPRPLIREDIERLNLYDGAMARFRLRPGITGMAQLYAGRGFRVTRLLEQRYLERQSVPLDAAILLFSLLVNIFGKRRIKGWLTWLRKKWPRAEYV